MSKVDFRSGIAAPDKQKIQDNLSDAKDAFSSFGQAQAWINKALGTERFHTSGCTTINIYAVNESRFGLLTIGRGCLTARGVKPLVPYQHQFKSFYLSGAYSPAGGDHSTLALAYCIRTAFSYIWMGLAEHRPEEFKILILDNGAFHKARRLEAPGSIGQLFVPSIVWS